MMPDSLITKRVLATSFKQILQEKSFSKITVADICGRCHMNRKSFYYHFKDKYDLVNWIFYTEFLHDLEHKDSEVSIQLLEALCEFFYKNKDFYRKTFAIEGQNSFSEYFREIIKDIIAEDIEKLFENEKNQNKEFCTQFFTDALTGSIKRWLAESDPILPQEFCDLVKSCLNLVSKKEIAIKFE